MVIGVAFDKFDEAFGLDDFKSYLTEFISTLLFVFTGVGSALAYDKLASSASLDPTGLIGVAVCHGFALFVAVAIAANIFGGHVNLAVTFGLVLGSQITILKGIFYWISQLVGAIVACLLLKFVIGGLTTRTHNVAAGMSIAKGVVMEIVIMFPLSQESMMVSSSEH